MPQRGSSRGRKQKRGFFFNLFNLIKRLICTCFILGLLGVFCIAAINIYIIKSTEKYIVNATAAPKSDCVIILGAGVYRDGSLSSMLYDRVKNGVIVARESGTEKFLMSGDHGSKDYDEVNPVLDKLESDFGIKRSDVFLDHAGFSTYDSMYRADYIFKVKSAVILTQKYHLPRAIYIARKKGINAYGVAADRPSSYYYMGYYKFREYLATAKDFVYTLFNFDPEFKGDPIPINGDGSKTHDK